MTKNIVLIFSILFLSIFLVGIAYILKNEDVCCSNSICKQFSSVCIDVDEEEKYILSAKGERIYLTGLEEGDRLEVGTVVNGSVSGSWYFEGVFPIFVLDDEGDILETIIVQSIDDWMQEGLVPFSFEFNVGIEDDTDVVLKFLKNNPSGLEENDDYATLSILASPSLEFVTLKVYFPNEGMDSLEDCSKVFPVERRVPKTVAVGRAALEELFMGPTYADKDKGFFTNIGDGVVIQSLKITDGVARVDLSSKLEEGVGGSCRVDSIRSQIETTLKQFSTVDTVIISIDGRTEDILQP